MLTSRPITKLVFLDIETRPKHETFAELPPKLKLLFSQQYDWLIEQAAHRHYLDAVLTDKKKADHEFCFQKAQEEVYKEKAVLSPEFSEIICISAGMIFQKEGVPINGELKYEFKCASFCMESEKELLTTFLANKKSFIHQSDYANNEKYVVTFNGSLFDIPFLSRRILYNGLELPAVLEVGHLKPWEMGHLIDLKTQIKFGGMDAPSLESLCTTLGIETAQDKYGEAEKLNEAFKAKQFDFIKQYCEQDIYALAQVYLRLTRSKEHPNGINKQLTKI